MSGDRCIKVQTTCTESLRSYVQNPEPKPLLLDQKSERVLMICGWRVNGQPGTQWRLISLAAKVCDPTLTLITVKRSRITTTASQGIPEHNPPPLKVPLFIGIRAFTLYMVLWGL